MCKENGFKCLTEAVCGADDENPLSGDLTIFGYVQLIPYHLTRLERAIDRLCLIMAHESNNPVFKNWGGAWADHYAHSIFELPAKQQNSTPDAKPPRKPESL